MSTSRLLSVSLVTAVTIGATVFACGGDDGGHVTGHPDAAVHTDAKVFMDAPGTSGYTGLGQACTPPAQGSGQGDCPAGFICLNLTGATHPWCSKPCDTANDTCAQGYTGPSVASCLESITFNGGAAMPFCGVTCSGDGVNGCTAATCTGMCPGGMTCNGTFTGATGSACQ